MFYNNCEWHVTFKKYKSLYCTLIHFVYQYILILHSFLNSIFHLGLFQKFGYSSLYYKNRTLLFIHSVYNIFHLLTPNSQSIPLPSPPLWQPQVWVCPLCIWVCPLCIWVCFFSFPFPFFSFLSSFLFFSLWGRAHSICHMEVPS